MHNRYNAKHVVFLHFFSKRIKSYPKYERRLDMRLGIVSRDVRWRSPNGHTLDFHLERFASLADQHVLAIRCQITSIDFAGE